MKPIITAFACSPDEGVGLARDMRVRWALEEIGQPYDVRLLSMAALNEPAHRSRNPFGSIPTYEAGDLVLFESGAIVLHIAQTHDGLLPPQGPARERAVMWIFAALNTVEPPIVEHEIATFFERDKPWRAEHLAMVEERVRSRLADLAHRLGDAAWLDGPFSAADLMMVLVLRRLEGSGLVEQHPTLAAYVERGKARPAYQRAFRDQAEIYARAVGTAPKQP